MLKFEWDPVKSKQNLKKHGVTFEEAQSVFFDEYAVQFFEESAHEDRFILLGSSNKSRILTIVHCERSENGDLIRIISARKATKSERVHYQDPIT